MSLKSLFGGKSDQQSAYEQAAIGSLKNANRLSNSLANYSQDQYTLARPALSQAMGLYSRLAGGDRSAIQGAIAPQVNTINENYRGGEKYLEQQGIRGGARDYAMADLNRQKTGQVATLPMLARSEATSQLAGLGERGVQSSLQGMGSAANAQANAAGSAGNLAQQEWARQQASGSKWASLGTGVASMFLPSLLGHGAGAAGGAGGVSKWAKLLPFLGGRGGSTNTEAYDPITGQYFNDREPGNQSGNAPGYAGGINGDGDPRHE